MASTRGPRAFILSALVLVSALAALSLAKRTTLEMRPARIVGGWTKPAWPEYPKEKTIRT